MEKFCERCGDVFESRAHNAKYCLPCRADAHLDRNKAYYKRKLRDDRTRARQQAEIDRPVAIEQGYMDLAFAVVERAFEERDSVWLREFGMEFLAFSGNPLNQRKFDNLLEEV